MSEVELNGDATPDKLAELKTKYKEYLTEDVIRHFSLRYDMDRESAIFKLCMNFETETERTDAKEIALNAMKGVRIMSPKLNGLESREQGNMALMKEIQAENIQINLKLVALERHIISYDGQIQSLKNKINESLWSWISKKLKTFLRK